MKFAIKGLSAALLVSVVGFGCASRSQEGVTSTYRTQSIDVYADVETTAAAAKQVFEEDNLANVSAQMDKVKGEVSADMADKTKVYASVEKNDRGSSLSVQVGKYVGDPKIGADYAAKIKQVAEGKK